MTMCEWCHERPASSALCVECSAVEIPAPPERWEPDPGRPAFLRDPSRPGWLRDKRGRWFSEINVDTAGEADPAPQRIPGDDWRRAIERRFR